MYESHSLVQANFALDPVLEADCATVCDLPLCRVLLLKDANYPWLILVPRINDLTEIIDLPEAEQRQLWVESGWTSQALQALFTPDKLNIAALGNVVSQLHIHHIARYKTDAAWPKPVWGAVAASPYTEESLQDMLEKIRQWFAKHAEQGQQGV